MENKLKNNRTLVFLKNKGFKDNYKSKQQLLEIWE